MFKIKSLFVLTLIISVGLFSEAAGLSRQSVRMLEAPTWLEQEARLSETLLLRNISPADTVLGTVVASPQREGPNYFRHWTRDAALVMDVVLKLSQRNHTKKIGPKSGPRSGRHLDQLMQDYVKLSRYQQQSAYIGEPIFEVNGEAFLGPWGRPQNDGPALRAIILTEWANQLLDEGHFAYVTEKLYQAAYPPNTLIKTDLEYVSWHWQDSSFDLWEEVKADHFYTRMVQRKSLLLGAKLARRLNDVAAAEWYEMQAGRIESALQNHISPGGDMVGASLNYAEGLNSKKSNLDIAVILGVLHGGYGRFLSISDGAIQKTFAKLVDSFAQIYPVNRNNPQLATALGRYPEDVYAGTNFDGGNPWVLATLAGAEYCYKMANETAFKNVKTAQSWIQRGDAFVQRVQFHANADGSLSEQIDRRSGFMTSASNLTWNYAAILTAFWAREQSQKSIQTILNKGKSNE